MQCLPERIHQLRNVVLPAFVGQLDGIAPGQRLEVIGKIVATGHLGTFDQHRNHPHIVALQCGAYLQAGIVVGVIQTAAAGGILQTHPARPDDRQQDAAGLQGMADGLDEIGDRVRVVDLRQGPDGVRLTGAL